MPRHPRGVFVEEQYNGHIVVNVWLSTGERVSTEYPARLLDDDEIVRLHRVLDVIDPIRRPRLFG